MFDSLNGAARSEAGDSASFVRRAYFCAAIGAPFHRATKSESIGT